MLYQLSNGRVINISVEEYLNMSDQDLQDLSAGCLGHYSTSPWDGSAIKNSKKIKEQSDIDKDIDYTEENDEIQISVPGCLATLTIITVDDITSYEQEDASEEAEEIKDT